jgi:hypothetical protein
VKDISDELSEEQRKLISTSNTLHEQLAVTWCLDNLAMLKNLGCGRFRFIFYEKLLLKPYATIPDIFHAFSLSAPDRRIEREVALLQSNAPKSPWDAIRGWEGTVSKKQLNDIDRIVTVFGLSELYEVTTGMPREPTVEQAMTGHPVGHD